MAGGGFARKVPALTGIRFFAASYVFIMHFGATAIERAGAPRPLATFLHNGIFGVSLFFILSGFILAHAHPVRFATPRQYVDYLIARLARLYPVYLLALLIALPPGIHEAKVPLTPQLAACVLAMVQSWTDAFARSGYGWIMQAWTLSVEFFFCLSFPFIANLLRRLDSSTLLVLCAIDAAFVICGGTTTVTPWITEDGNFHDPAWPLYLPLPLVRGGEFLFGMLLQTLISRTPHGAVRSGSALCLLVTAGVALLLSITAGPVELSVAAILAGVLIALIYVSDNAFTRLLGCRALVVLGNASYALYLLQGPLHRYLQQLAPGSLGHVLAFPVTLAASLLVWRYIEEPARRALTSLRPRDTAAPAPAPGRAAPAYPSAPAEMIALSAAERALDASESRL